MSVDNFRDLFSLSGKTALVTGATGILGQHFCRIFAQFGANVIAVDLDQGKLESQRDALKKQFDIQAACFACDVSDQAAVREMVQQAKKLTGYIDILHNNAATKTSDLNSYFSPNSAYASDTWKKVMGVNIDGMFFVAQAVADIMIQNKKGGSIIQTSSIYGILAPDQRIYKGSRFLDREINGPAVYTASKHAVIGLSKHLATIWAEHGIRVNSLVIGGVESGQNEEFQNRYADRIPLKRMATVSDVVGGVIYLASNASPYTTGHTLVIDGGLSAW
jgi:NAD(P)-dependent dehydrogenase (short-subunit alcohol dehydrogenase family)